MILQGHAVELALVDVGHLVVLPPHRAAGRGVQHVAEAVWRVELGDLDLLRVTGVTDINGDILSDPTSPTCYGHHSRARASWRWCCRSECSECSQSSCRCPLFLSALSAIREMSRLNYSDKDEPRVRSEGRNKILFIISSSKTGCRKLTLPSQTCLPAEMIFLFRKIFRFDSNKWNCDNFIENLPPSGQAKTGRGFSEEKTVFC